MASFFGSFPLYYYNDVLCKNITQRTVIAKQVMDDYTSFYDHELSEGDRPDIIAHRAYDNVFFDWMLYYANGVTDPYFDWYLDTDSFNKYIKNTYGSIAEAQERIMYYRVNWLSDDRRLTLSAYAALPSQVKKYWSPFHDDANRVVYYTRKQIDSKIGTNSIIEFTPASTAKFINGERVTQRTGSVVTASGSIAKIGSKMTVQHIEGTFVNGTITGMSSDATTTITDPAVIVTCIVPLEVPYWESVSYYDHELENNESKKNIRVFMPSVAKRIEQTHKDLLA